MVWWMFNDPSGTRHSRYCSIWNSFRQIVVSRFRFQIVPGGLFADDFTEDSTKDSTEDSTKDSTEASAL